MWDCSLFGFRSGAWQKKDTSLFKTRWRWCRPVFYVLCCNMGWSIKSRFIKAGVKIFSHWSMFVRSHCWHCCDVCVCFSVQDDDLETDLNKLRLRPEPDRPKELLPQYSRLCPELSHDFQVHTNVCVLCPSDVDVSSFTLNCFLWTNLREKWKKRKHL